MPLHSQCLYIPEPGTYIRYWHQPTRAFLYMRLVEVDYPLRYPRRLTSIGVGGKTNPISFRDLNPSKEKKHRYLAYLGVRDGALYYVYHPSEIQKLKFDQKPLDIEDDQTGFITYKDSPYDAPRFHIWIEPDRYPAVQALNVTDKTMIPEILWTCAVYNVQEQSDLPSDVLSGLMAGQIPSMPISFGGEI